MMKNGSSLRDYLIAFATNWVSLMGGIASVILGIVAAMLTTPLPRWSFWLAAVICLLFASYQTWAIERRRVADLTGTREQQQLVAEGLARLDSIEREILLKLLNSAWITEEDSHAIYRKAGRDPVGATLEVIAKKTHFIARDYSGYYRIEPAFVSVVRAQLLSENN